MTIRSIVTTSPLQHVVTLHHFCIIKWHGKLYVCNKLMKTNHSVHLNNDYIFNVLMIRESKCLLYWILEKYELAVVHMMKWKLLDWLSMYGCHPRYTKTKYQLPLYQFNIHTIHEKASSRNIKSMSLSCMS